MFHRIPILGTAIGLFLLAASASATPTCVATSGSITVTELAQPGGPGTPWRVAFTATGSAHSDVSVTAASNEPIAYVHATTNSNSAYRVDLTVTAPSIADASKVGGAGEFWVTPITTTTGDVGDVTANVIGDVTASAHITGDISSTGTSAGGAPDGIHALEATGGSITGDVTAVGRIGLMTASAGAIGTSSSVRATISAGSIGNITARSVFADITSGGGTGELNSLITTGTGGSTGDFTGSLAAQRITGNGLTYGLDVFGDLNADIDHDNAVMATHFRIGGSLVGDILLPANGVTKQIIINANYDGGAWTGDIKLNGSAIAADSNGEYAASSVGGGSVGLATFRLHDEACTPPNQSEIYHFFYDPLWQGEGDPPCTWNFTQVILRHYGPIVAVSPPPASLPVYKVEESDETCGSVPCGNGWTTVTTSFDFTPYPSADGVTRSFKVTPVSGYNNGKFKINFRYRITLQYDPNNSASTTLESDEVDEDPRVPGYVYNLLLLDGCGMDMDMRYDQNGDNSLTAEDLEAWPGDNPDVNDNGQVTAFDLYKLLCGYVQRDALPR